MKALNEMEDRPWPEWRRGKPMTQNSVSKLLKPFGVSPKKIRFHSDTVRGYERTAIQDAFRRYDPAGTHAIARNTDLQSGTLEHCGDINDLDEIQTGTKRFDVPPSNTPKALNNNDCSGVPVQNSQYGTEWDL